MLHPDFPIVEGRYQMTREWSVQLPGQFNRRFEEGELVIWKPGFTIWTAVWGNDNDESVEERIKWLKEDMSSDAFDVQYNHDRTLRRMCYRLTENRDGQTIHALYAFAVGDSGHVQMGIYLDDEMDLEDAKSIWLSLEETTS